MLQSRAIRQALFIGCGLQLFQQCVGINTIMYYSASIISMTGFGSASNSKHRDSSVVWMAALVAVSNFLFSLPSPWIIRRFKRRNILYCSLFGIFSSLLMLALSFQLMATYSVGVDLIEAVPVGFNPNFQKCMEAYV